MHERVNVGVKKLLTHIQLRRQCKTWDTKQQTLGEAKKNLSLKPVNNDHHNMPEQQLSHALTSQSSCHASKMGSMQLSHGINNIYCLIDRVVQKQGSMLTGYNFDYIVLRPKHPRLISLIKCCFCVDDR